MKPRPLGFVWAFFFPLLSPVGTSEQLSRMSTRGFSTAWNLWGHCFSSRWGNAGFHLSRWDLLLQESTWTQQDIQNIPHKAKTCKPTTPARRNLWVFLHPSEVPEAAAHPSSPQQWLKKPLLPSPRVLFLTGMISVIPFTAPQLYQGRGAGQE